MPEIAELIKDDKQREALEELREEDESDSEEEDAKVQKEAS